jgi:E3 ubiquitin-protein ligase DOA10
MDVKRISAIVVIVTVFIGVLIIHVTYLFIWRKLREIFDPLVYNNTYYNDVDGVAFSGFPLGIFRIGGYALAVVIREPRFLMKRYKGFDFRSRVSKGLFVGCVIFTVGEALGLLGLLEGVVWYIVFRGQLS